MKRISIIVASMLLCAAAYAQDGKSLYNKYSDRDDVTTVYISPNMFKLIGKIPDFELNDEDVNLAPIIKSLSGFFLISAETPSTVKALKADADRILSSGKYELMMETKDGDERVRIMTAGKGDNISSLVVLVSESDEIEFICIDGNISMNDLQDLIAKQMK